MAWRQSSGSIVRQCARFRAHCKHPRRRQLRMQPLVSDGSDSVHQAWTDWRKQSGVHRHGLGFYSLRRFFGDYATRVGGDSVGDAALAHTAKSVRQKHYSGYRDFEKVKEVGQRLHAELTAAGMFSEESEEVQDSSPMAGLHKLEPAVMSSPP